MVFSACAKPSTLSAEAPSSNVTVGVRYFAFRILICSSLWKHSNDRRPTPTEKSQEGDIAVLRLHLGSRRRHCTPFKTSARLYLSLRLSLRSLVAAGPPVRRRHVRRLFYEIKQISCKTGVPTTRLLACVPRNRIVSAGKH